MIDTTTQSTATTVATSHLRDNLPRGDSNESAMTVSFYSMEEYTQVKAAWEDLELRISDVPLTCSWLWTSTWLANYSNVVRPIFAVGTVGGTVRALCLLSEVRGKLLGVFPIRSLYLGTAGEPHGHSVCVEYNELLAEPDYRQPFLSALHQLLASRTDWDQFVLNGVNESNNQDLILPADNRTKDASIRSRESRYFDLQACRESGAEVLEQLGRSTRSNLKRRVKQLQPIEVEWAESLDQARDIYRELVELHQARWQAVGEPGAFASPRFDQFQRQLIEQGFKQRSVVLTRIRSAGETIGCLYLLNDRNRLLDYVSGFASFDQVSSPGLVSHYLCMNEALVRGYDAYDFLVGDKRHKENLGKSSNQLQWITCERKRLAFTVRDQLRQLKQLVKRSPKVDQND